MNIPESSIINCNHPGPLSYLTIEFLGILRGAMIMMLRRSIAAQVLMVVGLLAWTSRYASPQESPVTPNGQSQTGTTILSACERLSDLELEDLAINEAVAVPTIERQVYGNLGAVPRTSAFPESSHSELRKWVKMTGCFRPRAVLR